MNVTTILKYLEEKHGWKEATADHPIYSAPPTIRFINHSGSKAPTKQKKEPHKNSQEYLTVRPE